MSAHDESESTVIAGVRRHAPWGPGPAAAAAAEVDVDRRGPATALPGLRLLRTGTVPPFLGDGISRV